MHIAKVVDIKEKLRGDNPVMFGEIVYKNLGDKLHKR